MFLWESVLYKIEAGKAAVFLVVGSMLQHGGVVAREYGKPHQSGLLNSPKVNNLLLLTC